MTNSFSNQFFINPKRTDLNLGEIICRCRSGCFDINTGSCGLCGGPGFCENCGHNLKCIHDPKLYPNPEPYRCQCPKYSRYNYQTYKCDCLFRKHGPLCECAHYEWYDARYRICRPTTKAVWRQCLFNTKCQKVKFAYCQALGPREAGCACDNGYVYKKVSLPVDNYEVVKKEGRCVRDFTSTTFQTENSHFGEFGKSKKIKDAVREVIGE